MLSSHKEQAIASSPIQSDPTLTPAQFDRIARMVLSITGIVLKEHKSVMVQSRISRRLRELGFSDFDLYMDFLEGPEGNEEITNFSNAITTNLTSFFRENHHFEHLKNEIGEMAQNGVDRLRIWSAGCSTGEEPHCIAMILADFFEPHADKKILATDIDTKVLEKAKSGIYSKDKLTSIGQHHQAKTFVLPDGESFQFQKNVRAFITFNQLNLMDPWPFRGPFDFIFCRNVLIYFDAQTKANLINRYAEMLKPGGTLYLGHSETILDEHQLLVSEGRTTYRKRK